MNGIGSSAQRRITPGALRGLKNPPAASWLAVPVLVASLAHLYGCGPATGGWCAAAGLANEADMAATPRDDACVEALALRLGKGIVAAQSDYDRLHRDLSAIYDAAPDLRGIACSAEPHPDSIFLCVDDSTAKKMREGTYAAWDCLDAYAVAEVTVERLDGLKKNQVTVYFSGHYDVSRLRPFYAELPGVQSAFVNDGYVLYNGCTTSHVSIEAEGEVLRYHFKRATRSAHGADNPCVDIDRQSFSVDADGSLSETSPRTHQDGVTCDS